MAFGLWGLAAEFTYFATEKFDFGDCKFFPPFSSQVKILNIALIIYELLATIGTFIGLYLIACVKIPWLLRQYVILAYVISTLLPILGIAALVVLHQYKVEIIQNRYTGEERPFVGKFCNIQQFWSLFDNHYEIFFHSQRSSPPTQRAYEKKQAITYPKKSQNIR
ncbi:hypothetical protein G9A89_017858 [Geosiphon pyriformis]|nr:hypothetical protein G9A89_017858 [Geosiphon pyriformis]